jgi:hypothetical protein
MSRGLLLGELDRDLACAIALGFVQDPRVIADLECIHIRDTDLRPLASQSGWLNTSDPLDAATREYLVARREMARLPSSEARQVAVCNLIAVKQRVRQLLVARGVLRKARAAGLSIAGVWPAGT